MHLSKDSTMFLVPNIDQGNEENSVNIASQASIVEFGNKHGNRDKFPDFAAFKKKQDEL
jgi:hypothetical protein